MKIRTVVALLVLTAATALGAAAEQFAQLSLTVEPYPAHGLPGISPSLKVAITNAGTTAVSLPPLGLCMRGVDDAGTPFAALCGSQYGKIDDLNHHVASPAAAPVSVTVGAKQTFVTFVAPDENYYFDFLRPGTYQLRFFLNAGDIPSNTVHYTVDAPQGEDAVVWNAFLARKAVFEESSYLDDQLDSVFAAHPTSVYWVVWRHFQDAVKPGSLQEQVTRDETYVVSPHPVAWDGPLRLWLSGAYLNLAWETVRRSGAATDAAIQLVDRAHMILQSLATGTDPWAAAAASLSLAKGSSSQEQVRGWLRDLQPVTKSDPLIPHVDCVVLNQDGTYTASFGYSNPNRGIYDIPVGALNSFTEEPFDRGQPTRFLLGDHDRAFSLTMKRGEQATWKLWSKPAVANAEGDRANCGIAAPGGAKP